MEPLSRRFLIAMTAAVVIATSAGVGIADTRFNAKAVAETDFSDEQAGSASVSVQSFFYLYEGDYVLSDHLQGL